MADYIVTSGELTTVANAIREKNGTSSNLSWPDGFVSGISSGSGGGGGGSSDFSTAEVTLNAEGFSSLWCARIVDNTMGINVPFFIEHFEAILYKGSQVCDTSEIEGTITVSGGAVYDAVGQTITITGDCTITIS